jgi:pyruvate dehydrogenase E2 component (dihydrolipoamide acetyltransferase)
MSKITEVIAPVSNVNDTTVEIYEFFVDDKAKVSAEQEILEIETSKATQKIAAPCDGIIKFLVEIGDEVPNEAPLAIIAESIEELENYGKEDTSASSEKTNVVLSSAGIEESVGEKPSVAGADVNSSGACGEKPVAYFGRFNHSVTLGETMRANGESVSKDEILCKVRDGSKVLEVKAPQDGFVYWAKDAYATIHSDEYAGVISSVKDDSFLGLRDFFNKSQAEKSSQNMDFVNRESETSSELFSKLEEARPVYNSLRFSKAAKKLLEEKGLTAEALGLSGLVTVNTVNDILNQKRISSLQSKFSRTALNSGSSAVVPNFSGVSDFANSGFDFGLEKSDVKRALPTKVMHSTEGSYEKLTKAKKSEAEFLSEANRDAVVSQVSVLVPTKGIFSACSEDSDLAKKFSSIIIFETSRLLKQYNLMNSVYDDGRIFVYDSINVGYALAIDNGLKVPVFKNSDKKSLDEIITEKDGFIEKYILRELSPEDLSGGTFTITDLSSTGCYFFNPVLNLGQSAILGIGSENPSGTDYPLILAFDHRVIDGATATEFLCSLRDRLLAHERVLLAKEVEEDIDGVGVDNFYESADFVEAAGASELTGPFSEVDSFVQVAGSLPQMAELGSVNTFENEAISSDDSNSFYSNDDESVADEDIYCEACYRSLEEVEKMGYYLFKTVTKGGREKKICSICMMGW